MDHALASKGPFISLFDRVLDDKDFIVIYWTSVGHAVYIVFWSQTRHHLLEHRCDGTVLLAIHFRHRSYKGIVVRQCQIFVFVHF